MLQALIGFSLRQRLLVLVATLDGALTADVRPLVRMNVTVIVEQDGRREQGYQGTGGRYALEELLTPERGEALAREAVRHARYPRAGVRGIHSVTRATRYGREVLEANSTPVAMRAFSLRTALSMRRSSASITSTISSAVSRSRLRVARLMASVGFDWKRARCVGMRRYT